MSEFRACVRGEIQVFHHREGIINVEKKDFTLTVQSCPSGKTKVKNSGRQVLSQNELSFARFEQRPFFFGGFSADF